MRQSWLPSIESWAPHVRAEVEVVPVFRDLTGALADFSTDIESGQIRRIRPAVNSTPYPTVRCTQRCFVFIDDYLRDRMAAMPACHYLAAICSQFRAFDADPSLLKGACPRWTTPVVDLEWTVTPSVIVTEGKRICILHCSKKIHSSSSKQWLHVPSNPILGIYAPSDPYIQGPVILSSNCIRGGRPPT